MDSSSPSGSYIGFTIKILQPLNGIQAKERVHHLTPLVAVQDISIEQRFLNRAWPGEVENFLTTASRRSMSIKRLLQCSTLQIEPAMVFGSQS